MRGARLRRLAVAACVALPAVAQPLAARALGAQSNAASAPSAASGATTAVTGSIRDTTGRPVIGAGVQLDGVGEWHGVNAEGAFRVLDVRVGYHVVRFRALGFAPVQATVMLSAADTAVIDVVLARAVAVLDTVRTVAAADPSATYGPAEFQERRRVGRGIYLTRDAFEDRAPTRLSDLLARLPGVERHPVESPSGNTEYVLVMRGTSTAHGELCPINIYMDGRGFAVDAAGLDGIARPSEIDAIEIYPGSSQVPLRFSGPTARCGVIALWSRSTGR